MGQRLARSDLGDTLLRGALGVFTINAAGAALAFGTQVLLARVMGAGHFGVYVYVLSWVTILVLVGKMGMDEALLRFVAAYTARKEWDALSGVLRFVALLVLTASILLGGAGAIAVWILEERLSSELAWTLWIGFALLPVMALTYLRQAALRALGRAASALMPDQILRPLLLAGLVVVAFFGLGRQVDGATAMVLNLGAATVAFLVGVVWLARSLPANAKGARPVYQARQWVVVALPLFLISGMHIVHNQTDILMIGSLLGTREAGIYAAATRIATLVLAGLIAVNTIVAPMISRLYATDRIDELQRIVSQAARRILFVSLPVGLALAVLGRWVLSFFGAEFVEGSAALVILIGGQLINALAGSVGFLMMMTGHEREAASIMTVSVVLNVGLNAVLIPVFGMEGAAFATALTTALWNILMLLYVQRRLGINSTAFRLSW